MTDTIQKLREALQAFEKRGAGFDSCPTRRLPQSDEAKQIDQWWLRYFMDADLSVRSLARQALALPTAEQVDDINVAESFTSVTKTAAPVGERELFERTMMDKFGWERKDFKTDGRDFYMDGNTVTAWMAWQARAALSAGDAVDAQRLDFIEKSARRDPKMDGQHVWWPTSLNKALKGATLRDAIDAAMRNDKP